MKKLVAALSLAALMSAALVPAMAFAKDGDIKKSGSCSGNSTWKLKLSDEDGKIETEFEVDQNVNGDKWRVVLKRDGKRYFKGVRTTKPPSGSFEVRRVISNSSGPDRVRARAVNLQTDEVCTGKATF
jgi:hypothetical protein